jgi:hypothetical protein
MARPETPIEHGTPRGYQKHQRRGEPHTTCGGACQRAWADKNRERRQKAGK